MSEEQDAESVALVVEPSPQSWAALLLVLADRRREAM